MKLELLCLHGFGAVDMIDFINFCEDIQTLMSQCQLSRDYKQTETWHQSSHHLVGHRGLASPRPDAS